MTSEPRRLVVFRCEPLATWLGIDACATRYGKATVHGLTYGRDKFKALHGTHCTNCPIGAEHKRRRQPSDRVRVRVLDASGAVICDTPPKAPPSPTTTSAVERMEPEPMPNPVKLSERSCRMCGNRFMPRGSTDVCCSDDCRRKRRNERDAKLRERKRAVSGKAAALPRSKAYEAFRPKGERPLPHVEPPTDVLRAASQIDAGRLVGIRPDGLVGASRAVTIEAEAPTTAERVASARELLELAGYRVRALTTPAGLVLIVA